jgi:polar amino acid transport system substrate-binding protein
MMRWVCWLLMMSLPAIAVAQDSAAADQRVIRLNSLEWPPYSSAALPQQGASIAVARAAAEAMGYRLEVVILPWARAQASLDLPNSSAVGLLPVYHSPERAERYLLSAPLGRSPLGIIERRAAPIHWRNLDELSGRWIGIVNGYHNTEEFDARVVDGRLNAEAVNDDASNLRKLGAARLDLAVIDRRTMHFLLTRDEDLVPLAEHLQFNAHLLQDKDLLIAFRRSAAGEAALEVMNAGLLKIDAEAIAAPYFD